MQTIEILYRNYRGEVAWRNIEPIRLEYGNSPWHKGGPDWILIAKDTEKNQPRDFLLKDILCIGTDNVEALLTYMESVE